MVCVYLALRKLGTALPLKYQFYTNIDRFIKAKKEDFETFLYYSVLNTIRNPKREIEYQLSSRYSVEELEKTIEATQKEHL